MTTSAMTLEVATTEIDVDGFAMGSQTPASAGTPDNSWIVVDQDPGRARRRTSARRSTSLLGDPDDPATLVACP